MSQLRQFLQRNLHGQQTLKPVVRSYYAHSPTTKQGFSYTGSDSVTYEGVSNNIGGTDGVQGEMGSDSLTDTPNPSSPARRLQVTSHEAAPQPAKPADDAQLTDHSASNTAHFQQTASASRHGLSKTDPKTVPSSDSSLNSPENLEALHLSAADHSTADFGGEVTPRHADYVRDPETPTAYSGPNPPEEKFPPVGSPAKRRDFTREVAASIFSQQPVSEPRPNPTSAASMRKQSEGQTPHANHDVSVSVTIREVNIVPPAAPVKEKPSWQPPKSLSQYLSEREGKR
ncbi:hypothetical protein [Enterovibrio paralichthyis]|uniref:hypothetical protein n=1 Tax=Enterovibrio paralichthyis TaxID=2853805 RepID=UPI001C47FD1D|nr:hypothetical protein [Enterovibrio paralichthyis]MBV7298298.1 hypothetical protein [Enterovibrio paralichthyis]